MEEIGVEAAFHSSQLSDATAAGAHWSNLQQQGKSALEIEKLNEPQLSGACIRSLVKHLSSSRTKDSSNSIDPKSLLVTSYDEKQEKPHQPPPTPHKKQVRRRLHTSRPYQERLLNMAEARREIVTALKFHRAAMKQASEKRQQQQQEVEMEMEISPQTQLFSLEKEDNFSYSTTSYSSYSWAVSPIAPPPVQENLNFPLPSQALGLNLNLQDFSNLDSTFNCSSNPSSIYSSSSPSTSSSLSATTDGAPCMGSVTPSAAELGDSGLHAVMDAEEIAEIRSIGEQYQMEWNDTLNLVNSAWWFKFLKSMEITPENQSGEGTTNFPFDEVMEFPAWLDAKDAYFQHHYFEDHALPCMDIEEIEAMDGDWLA